MRAASRYGHENGKAVLIPSYSLLQDRFFEHMRNAGFKDFERGVRGSTTQHLSVLDYKIQQDNAKLARIEQEVETQQKELATVSKQLTVERRIGKTFRELDELGRKKMFGKVTVAAQDFKDIISLAKEGVFIARQNSYARTEGAESNGEGLGIGR